MLERTYNYLGYDIDQYIFDNKRYFYPKCNGNAEFTNIRDCVKYIKTLTWIRKMYSRLNN